MIRLQSRDELYSLHSENIAVYNYFKRDTNWFFRCIYAIAIDRICWWWWGEWWWRGVAACHRDGATENSVGARDSMFISKVQCSLRTSDGACGDSWSCSIFCSKTIQGSILFYLKDRTQMSACKAKITSYSSILMGKMLCFSTNN